MAKTTKSIIYCTCPGLDENIRKFCFDRLKKQAKESHAQLVTINQDTETPKGIRAYYDNLILGIARSRHDIVFIAEHDVCYPDNYFNQHITDEITYCSNVVYLLPDGFRKREYSYAPLSTLAGDKKAVKRAIERKIEALEAGTKIDWFEPGIDDSTFAPTFREFPLPILDIRHGGNFTKNDKTFFPETDVHEYWGKSNELWQAIGIETRKTVNISIPEKVSIIITAKDETKLPWTIENIKRTVSRPVDIIVIYDGWQKTLPLPSDVIQVFPWANQCGVGPCRHFGICGSKSDYVILLDAHMDFQNNWIEPLLDPVRQDEKSISCSRSAVLWQDQLVLSKAKVIHNGANLKWMSASGLPFDPLWSEYEGGSKYKPGDFIQCLLGATYCFKKSRYLSLGSPWRQACGWGSSEQILSMVNTFMGGQNILADCITGHVYDKTPEETHKRRYNSNPQLAKAGMYYNRLRLIDILPMPDDKKRMFSNRVLSFTEVRPYLDQIKAWFDNRPDSRIKEMLQHGMSWEAYVERWWGNVSYVLPPMPVSKAPEALQPVAMPGTGRMDRAKMITCRDRRVIMGNR